jgi:hypothetical protein
MSYSDSDMDVMDDLAFDAQKQRQADRRICSECGRMGGNHATGCPGDERPIDEQEEEAQ